MIPSLLRERTLALRAPSSYFHGRGSGEVCLVENVIFFRRTTRSELQRATFEMRPHHRFVLIFNLLTAGVVRIDGVPLRLEPGNGLMILPFQFHTFPEAADERLLWLVLTFEARAPEALEDFRGKVFPLSPALLRDVAELLRLYRSTRSEAADQLLRLDASRLVSRLRLLVRPSLPTRKVAGPRARQLLNDVEARLRQASGEAVTIADLAAALHLSESRLRDRFRAAFGMSLGFYLRNYRLHRIIERMRDTRLNLSEIAQELDFSDSAAFSRFFRNETGMTPSSYRRRLLRL
jgi:AraC-like DNA-binding protein